VAAVFYRGMVVDIISSVSGLTLRNKSIEDYKSLINSENLKSFPRNTAVVKQISEGLSKTNDSEVICYPFFSSHLCMPLKPGECVWFIYENPDNKGSIAYWLSRVTEPSHAEDVNHTLFARSYRQAAKKQEPSTAERFSGETAKPAITQTYSYVSPTGDTNEIIDTMGFASQVCRIEAIPRYNKRPGDLILQGSNNSLIMLGEERGHFAESTSAVKSSANTTNMPSGLAAIDIVVGRGKFASTAGSTILNELGLPEIDKQQDPPTEGDAHFPTDAARLYLTANSKDILLPYHPDKLLNISLPSTSGLDGSLASKPGSFFVGKADNLRLVARSSGDIRIVKEPTSGGGIDSSAIIFHSDGTLQASGRKIFLSKYNTATVGSEPYVKYSGLMTLVESMVTDYTSIASDINDFCTSFNSAIPQIAFLTTATGPVTNGGPLVALLTSAAGTLQGKAAAMKAKETVIKKMIGADTNKIKSTTIFGE
jgi:hypothetical protein